MAEPEPPAVAAGPATSLSPESSSLSLWHAEASADRAYFDFVQDSGGAEVAALTFPAFYPIRRFSLRGPSMLIGRYSARRGINPEIDLSGRPEDPAVGRMHAQLVSRPDGCWAVVDLESTNHTYLNDFTSDPIRPDTMVDLRDGDRIYLGAWTMLTVHAGPLPMDGER
ncbi:MAG TPA: FHA domain-containing protein [Pseudonocardiaceae bacterium]|nr:FHA domain-containing protein [Pseudonocardiaceae bacterium]